MSDIIEGVHPTRMELLKIKEKTELAVKGHRLLKEKRDALMMEFMKLSRKAEETTSNTLESMDQARRMYGKAKGSMGSANLMVSALDSGQRLEVEMDKRNIMGVQLPSIEIESLTQFDAGYDLYSTEPIIDEAANAYRGALENILGLVEVEGGLRALQDETKKTKRRVNALEHKRIPQLNSTTKYIQLRLDELERENYYRLKMVKKKKERESES